MDLKERIRLKKADRPELYSINPPFPVSNFLLELSNICNHKCIFCAHNKMKRPIGFMPFELAQRVLQEAYDLGTREVGFYATGEPFLVKDLPRFIKAAKDIGYTYTYLTSNGAKASPDKIKAVIDAGLDSIKFSINAPERELYKFIHDRDDFDVVCRNLQFLHDYREECGRQFKIFVTGILTRFTEDLQDEYSKKFGHLADEIVFKYVYNQGGYMPEIDALLKCRTDHEERRRCNLPFDALCVTCEGYLSLENADYENMLIVADLNKVSLKDGWYGPKMKQVREMFLSDHLEGTLCDGCVHHCLAPAKPLLPEYATQNDDIFNDKIVRMRIKEAGFPYSKLVYVPMSADIIHHGHINLLKKAAKFGRVMVGLFSDEAIASYKRPPVMSYDERLAIVSNLKDVYCVVKQDTKDYVPNLERYMPDVLVHGTDWREGPLSDVRQKAIEVMAKWGGVVEEPEYTKGISSRQIKQRMLQITSRQE